MGVMLGPGCVDARHHVDVAGGEPQRSQEACFASYVPVAAGQGLKRLLRTTFF